MLGLIVAYQLGFREPATEQAFELAFALCFISALLMMLLGIWWLTTQEPRDLMREIPGSDRRLARSAVVVAALLGLIMITKPTFVAAYILIGCVSLGWGTAVMLGAYFGLRHVRSLAGRLPDAALVKRCDTHSRIIFWVAGCFAACSLFRAVTYSLPRFRVVPAGTVMFVFLTLGSIGFIMLIQTAMTFNRFLRALRWTSTQQHP